MRNSGKAILLSGVASFIVLGLITMYGIRLYKVNSEIPSPELSEYAIGDSASLSNETQSLGFGDLTVRVVGVQRSSFNSLADEISGYEDLVMKSGGANDGFVLLVTADITNTMKETISVPIYLFVLTSGSWANSIDPTLTSSLNGVESFDIRLKSRETRTITLPFCIYDTQFNPSSWRDIDNRTFSLTLSTYPKKVLIDLEKMEGE